MTTAASPADILRAVERWARVRGFHPDNPNGSPWLCFESATGEFVIRVPFTTHQWAVSSGLALAWALLVETDAGPVDVGRCPACVARSPDGARKLSTREWKVESGSRAAELAARRRIASRESPAPDGWLSRFHRGRGGRLLAVSCRQCPACNGTGIETIPVVRLLLDAASENHLAACPNPHCERGLCHEHAHTDGLLPQPCPSTVCFARRARDRLLVHADQLQAAGDPLGVLLGWALVHWTGEPTEPIWSPDWAADVTGFGHPHTAEALRWLEWLTWARELAAPCPHCEGSGWERVLGYDNDEQVFECSMCSGSGRAVALDTRPG